MGKKIVQTLAIAFLICFSLGLPNNSYAQLTSDPKEEPVSVSAFVPSQEGPSAPILVSPENGSFVNENPPPFVWEASEDDYGMDHYEFNLDGSTLFGNLPLDNHETDDYILEYDDDSQEYTLQLKSHLDEGSHTWKVRAIDNTNIGTDSATWSFTIDTLAPNFVLIELGDIPVSISAQDPSTIPQTPIELSENRPLLLALGEANASVQLTVFIPGDPTQSFTVPIASDGTWNLPLGILPRNQIITLEFVITDQASNVNVLSNVQFIILPETIIIPPTATPFETPSSTPLPSGEEPPEPSDTPPLSPQPTPLIEIPFSPPEEVIHEVIQETLERIPSPIAQLTTNIPEKTTQAIIKTAAALAPYSSLAATAATPAISFAILISQFGQQMSWKVFIRLLQATGLLPKKKPQGIVFNSYTNEPVSFALLTITSADEMLQGQIHETTVTDLDGIYQGIQLPLGKYIISVVHQQFTFPSQKERPSYFSVEEFYKGEVFEIDKKNQQLMFMIPVDPLEKSDVKITWRKRLKFLISRIKLRDITLPLFIVSLLVAVFFPSIINWVIVCLYLGILLTQFISSQRIPSISGKIIDRKGNIIPKAIVRVIESETSQLASIVISDENGEFACFIKKGRYHISVTKKGFAQYKESAQLSFEEINTTKESQYVVIAMQDISHIYQEMM